MLVPMAGPLGPLLPHYWSEFIAGIILLLLVIVVFLVGRWLTRRND